MPRPLQKWKVLPHGSLTQIGDRILTVTGKVHMPLVELERRMTIVRLRDGQLVIWNAIALAEDEMKQIETFGVPAYLIVPGAHHRLDAKVWKQRYPSLRVIAPEGARDAVQELLPVDATTADFDDPSVQLGAVSGTHGKELVLVVHAGDETTIVVNDLIANVHGEHGLGGWLLRLMGFAGPAAQIPKVVKSGLVDDAQALRRQLLAWSELSTLQRVLPGHGDPIEQPKEALRAIAATLA